MTEEYTPKPPPWKPYIVNLADYVRWMNEAFLPPGCATGEGYEKEFNEHIVETVREQLRKY